MDLTPTFNDLLVQRRKTVKEKLFKDLEMEKKET